MNQSRCDHNYFAVPYPDESVKIECIHCKDSREAIHAQDNEIVQLSLKNLYAMCDKYNELLYGDEKDFLLASEKVPVLIHQMQILEKWLSVTSEQSPVTSEQSPVTSEQSPVTSEKRTSINLKANQIKQLDLVEELARLNKKRRVKGEGSGEIIYRISKPKKGKTYKQMFFKVTFWRNSDRMMVKSFYVPKRLEDWVKQAQSQRLPVKDILKKVAPSFSP